MGQANPDPESVSGQSSGNSAKKAIIGEEAKKTLQTKNHKAASPLAAKGKASKGNGSEETVKEAD